VGTIVGNEGGISAQAHDPRGNLGTGVEAQVRLERVCGANPACPAIKHGRPRLLVLARLMPKSAVEPPKCRSCGWVTRLMVLPDGTPELRAWPARRAA
jgi:hypothetical protein